MLPCLFVFFSFPFPFFWLCSHFPFCPSDALCSTGDTSRDLIESIRMKHATVAHALTQRKCSWSSNAPGGHALNLTLIAQWRPVHFVFIFQCFIHAHMQSTTDASTFFQIQCQLLCNSAQFNPSLDQPSTTFQLLPYPLLNFHPYSHQVFSSFIISPYVSAELKKKMPLKAVMRRHA